MNDRDMWWKIVIIGIIGALAYSSVYPIDEKMKFGIDLRGGYSLLYEIDDTGVQGMEKQDLAKNVMSVLRERVDPKGVYNLVWRPIGHNRIEIQMPQPGEEITKSRQEFEGLQARLRATTIKRSDVVRVISAPPEQRSTEFATLAGEIKSRIPLLEAAAKAHDDLLVAQKAYDDRKAEIQRNSVTEAEVKEALKLKGDERRSALDALVRGRPERNDLLQAAARAFDEYVGARGAAAATSAPAATEPEEGKKKYAAMTDAINKVVATNIEVNNAAGSVTLDEVVRLEEIADKAIGAVVDTNIELTALQQLLALKPTDSHHNEVLKSLQDRHLELRDLIDRIVKANDRLQSTRSGEGRLEDPADLERLLKGAGVLDFRILPANDDAGRQYEEYREGLRKRGPRPLPGEEMYQWFEIEDPMDFIDRTARGKPGAFEAEFESRKTGLPFVVERYGDKYYVLSHISEVSTMTHRAGQADWSLKTARPDRDENGRPAIHFELDQRGGSKFGELTRTYRGQQLCIFLDDKAVSSARINAVITTSGIIQGSFTQQDVRDMVKKLNAGSLPRKLKDEPISIRAIGPSLGKANREAGLLSAKWGAICVVVFMMGYYLYAGAVAVFAVGINVLLIGAMMVALGATMTLPGVAGLVLAAGMAVDANVLINERIREELGRGTAMRMAIKLGYERAFRAILDSNLTTILTCAILYFVGSEEVKGFGLTLGVGTFINIFTAYFVTRIFFEFMVMISIPAEVKKNPVVTGLVLLGVGAAFYGLGLWRNSDEIARQTSLAIGFGKTLMFCFPAIVGLLLLLYVFRAVHAAVQKKRGRPSMPMMRMIGTTHINWVGLRPVFFLISLVITVTSLIVFTTVRPMDLYDIEFLGGTSAQIDLKKTGIIDRNGIVKRLEQSADHLNRFGDAMSKATITGSAGSYKIQSPGVPSGRLEPVVKVVMADVLAQSNAVSYADPGSTETLVLTNPDKAFDPEQAKKDLAARFKSAGESIQGANLQTIDSLDATKEQEVSYSIISRETSKEILVDAIMDTLGDVLDIQPALTFKLMQNPELGNARYFPVSSEDVKQIGAQLSQNEASRVDLAGWQGGVAIILDDVQPPQSFEIMQQRIRDMRLQPGFETHGWRQSAVFGLTPAEAGSDKFKRLMVVVIDENFPLRDADGGISDGWVRQLAEPEVQLIQTALQRQTSLRQITQFDRQVSGEAQVEAYVALALSWLLIVVYLWFRFGNIRWGFSAIVALLHDILVALGCVAGTYYLAGTALGRAIGIDQNIRIDMTLVAALLTIIGYSVNDTIIIFDRIRENRGRLTEITVDNVNASINQTLARTLLTSLTAIMTLVIMYAFGGPAIHGFSFVMLIGILTGTYSSFAIAAQFLLLRQKTANA